MRPNTFIRFVFTAVVAVALASCSERAPLQPDATAAALSGAASASSSVSTPLSAASRDTVDVHVLPSFAVVPGSSSMLVRNDNGVTGTVHTDGLTAGNAYTMWFVVFNNPGACVGGCGPDDLGRPAVQASVMFGTGHVVGGEGNNFAGWRGVGDTDGVIAGPGLLDPRGAEIHLVIRDHGPAIPGLIDEQIHSFNGGCPPNSCGNVQAAAHMP